MQRWELERVIDMANCGFTVSSIATKMNLPFDEVQKAVGSTKKSKPPDGITEDELREEIRLGRSVEWIEKMYDLKRGSLSKCLGGHHADGTKKE